MLNILEWISIGFSSSKTMGATNAVPAGERGRLIHGFANVVRTAGAKCIPLLPFFILLAGVFACTWISFRLGQNLASVGFLYLVFVVLAAVYGGFLQAA